jgi:hypothetical protein
MVSGERWAVAGTAGRVGPLRPYLSLLERQRIATLRDRGLGVREIARGLHPAALAEGGLRPALKTLARRSAVPVRLDVGVEASAAGSCCTARPARAPPCR